MTDAPTADLAHITTWARDRGLELVGLEVASPDLEDIYLRLIDEARREVEDDAGHG